MTVTVVSEEVDKGFAKVFGQSLWGWKKAVETDSEERVIFTAWSGKGVPSGAVKVAIRKNNLGIDELVVGESRGNSPYVEGDFWPAVQDQVPTDLIVKLRFAGIKIMTPGEVASRVGGKYVPNLYTGGFIIIAKLPNKKGNGKIIRVVAAFGRTRYRAGATWAATPTSIPADLREYAKRL